MNILIAFESLLLIGMTALAVQVRKLGLEVTLSQNTKVFLLLIAFPIIWLFSLSLFGAWDITIFDNHIDGYGRLLKSSFMTFLAFSSASYIFKIQISRFVILFSLVCGTIIHLILRWIFLTYVEKKNGSATTQDRWLVLTCNPELSSAAEDFAKQFNPEIAYFEAFDKCREFRLWVDEVISETSSGGYSKLVVPSTQGFSEKELIHLAWKVQQSNKEIIIYDHIGLIHAQSEIKRYSDFNWVAILPPPFNDSQRVVKRIFDVALVVPALVVLSPIFLAFASAIKFDSPGSVIYTQKRIGQDGKLFTFPKFRSMKQGSDDERLKVLGRPDESMAERYMNDPRITRVGRALRRYSLDELPQLWCVLIGTMSLVGPRPILPEEEVQLGDTHFRRHIAKPGLTGIWQVSGRKDTTWDDRMAFDLKYVQEWSLALDMILILKTFRAIISGKGSY
jgi:exopolysaccharide biosynthesis polyprenyl glycosylphosphotransferase